MAEDVSQKRPQIFGSAGAFTCLYTGCVAKVLLHNLSAAYTSVAPELFSFDRNALLFAELGDVVVVRGRVPEETYLAYLRGIGVAADGVQFFVSPRPTSPHSVFEDVELIADLRAHLTTHPGVWALDTYAYTHHEHFLAEQLGIPSVRNPEHFYRYGTKSGFRTSAKQCSVATPRGYEHLTDEVSVGLAMARLFLRGANEVVVKQDEGAAGLSLRRYSRRSFLEQVSQFDIEGLLPHIGILPAQSKRYVVEEWYGDVLSAPSIEFFIHADGVVTLSSAHEQILYPDGQTYRGCRSAHWLGKEVRAELECRGMMLAQALADVGARGPVAFDAIVRTGGEVLFVEANIRRIMSSYAHQIARRVSRGTPEVLPYISVRLERPKWKGKGFADILRELERVLYTQGSSVGVIPYDIGMLTSHGRLSLLCIGPSIEAVESLYRQVVG